MSKGLGKFNDPLPSSYGENIPKEVADKYVKDFLKELLPRSDVDQVDAEENWHFPLDKLSSEEKKRKQKPHKKKLLTRNDKKKLVLNKSELIGAEISVVRSKVPSYVGVKGIIVFETKFTFQIVTPESKFKVITKDSSVFEIYLRNMKFTIYGKSMLTRPSDKSIKKIKSYIFPDL
ncbi:hypothetical protein Trydic_g2486 [Trypoxylus dichotomus]